MSNHKFLRIGIVLATLISFCFPIFASGEVQHEATVKASPETRHEVRKILFIGDSMTGWLAERLNAYGKENGFSVSTVVWDGSTIQKWSASQKLAGIIAEQKPDAVFVSLGMNELFETNPEKSLKTSITNLKKKIGNLPIIWIGPPSWPGHNKGGVLDKWLSHEMGTGHYFSSFSLELPRQTAKNPHPSREGMIKWMDTAMEWIKDNSAISLPGYNKPTTEKMSRPKTFIYKRMKETF